MESLWQPKSQTFSICFVLGESCNLRFYTWVFLTHFELIDWLCVCPIIVTSLFFCLWIWSFPSTLCHGSCPFSLCLFRTLTHIDFLSYLLFGWGGVSLWYFPPMIPYFFILAFHSFKVWMLLWIFAQLLKPHILHCVFFASSW